MDGWRSLDVTGATVLVAGGPARVIGVVTELSQAGADVLLMSADTEPVATVLIDLADRGLIRWDRRAPTAADLDTASLLVISHPNGPDADGLARLARGARVLVHRVPEVPADVRAVPGEVDAVGDRAVGEVVLVGGGPGDPGLLTVAGLAAIESADVIACDRLAPLSVLNRARPEAEIIDVGKIPRGAFAPQEAINALLIDRARAGLRVVRFKGGDNFIFGRGGEEWQACAAAGVPVRVISGVSSAIAAPAAAGIPLTHRSLTQGFVVVSGHVGPNDPRSTVDWSALGRSELTLVVLMGLANLPGIAAHLIAAGRDPATPAAAIADGTLPTMCVVRAGLAELAESTAAAGLQAPVTMVIGAVAAFDPTADLIGPRQLTARSAATGEHKNPDTRPRDRP